jgi:penicillin-binding protein 2
LNESPEKPLYNRPLKGTYSPGSTYKPFMALAALETGKRTPNQSIADPGYFILGNNTFRDDKVGGHGTVDMAKSIVDSCNTYYYHLARDMGVNPMHDFMKPLGFGQITGIDLDGEARGILPSTAWKEKAFKKVEQQKWFEGETISLGIGQGYNSFTILQLAHASANSQFFLATVVLAICRCLAKTILAEAMAVVCPDNAGDCITDYSTSRIIWTRCRHSFICRGIEFETV